MSVAKTCQRDKSPDSKLPSNHIQQRGGRSAENLAVYVSVHRIDGCSTLSAEVSLCTIAMPFSPPIQFTHHVFFSLSLSLFLGCLQSEMNWGGLKAPAVNDTHWRQRICNAKSFPGILVSTLGAKS